MSEFSKEKESAPAAKLNMVNQTLKKDDAAVDDVTESVAKVKIRHEFEGDRSNYRNTFDHLKSGISFNDLSIPPSCLHALTHDLKYSEPTQIQAETIPIALKGRNVLAQAQAGSGKSIAFAIGMLNRVDTTDNRTQAICIAPTRHLASQLMADAVTPLAKYMDPPCRTELAVKSEDPKDRGPPKGATCPAHIVVGTAGTVIKWIKDKYISANAVKIYVVDEADVMVKESKGGSTQALQIKNKLPKNIQTLFFSATYPPDILALANSLVGENAVTIKVKKVSDLILDKIFQVKVECKTRSKVDILEDVYSYFSIQQSMVFCETKRSCDEVAAKLQSDGFTCSVIHSAITNADEEFELFRQNKTKVLISTDILARGIDVPTVAIVINYDVPRLFDERARHFTSKADCETYTHRIARCSRMGNPGTAISLLKTPQDTVVIREIEEHFDTFLKDWDENDIESLSEKHAQLQSGAADTANVDEKEGNDNTSWA